MTSRLLSAAAALVSSAAASPRVAESLFCAAFLLSSSALPLLAQAPTPREGTERPGQQPVCGTADPRTRIYVALGGSDSPDCGATLATACASIQHGIDRCAAQGAGCGVLVRYGHYKTNATIALRDGVSVYGSCVFDNVAGQRYRTVVEAVPAAGTPAVSADAINTPTTISGLVIVGKDETALGTASVAMAVGNSSGLALRSMVLLSGQGGPGTDGTTNASPVGNGGEGTTAQSVAWGWVGVGGQSCPSNPTTTDGTGGLAGTVAGFDGWECQQRTYGQQGAASGSVPGGTGGAPGTPGIWCSNRPHDQPGDGSTGMPGKTGQAGAQANASLLAAGSIVQAGWRASKGDDGRAGAVGSGGGGGGQGGSCKYYDWPRTAGYQGFAGAAGGGGGCGGGAGTGGQQGGASIALILSSSPVNFGDQSLGIIAGAGGRGGKGGNSVSGGAGGAGGAGLKSGQSLYWARWCPGLSGNGGQGGDGGPGSGAAGGNGGPSIGIALAGNSPAPPSDNGIYLGVPGNGGARGAGGPAVTRSWGTIPAGPDGQDGLTGKAAASVQY